MVVADWLANNGGTTFGELDAVRLACSALARLFSYPSKDEAALYTNDDSFVYLYNLMAEALLTDENLTLLYEAAISESSNVPDERAQRMRHVFTQLFYSPHAPIPLEGRYWIRRKPSDPLARLGEEASVRESYQCVGVHVRSGVVEQACALPTELDFVAYLLTQEISCSCAGDGAQALAWKQRRRTFCRQHLVCFGNAVSEAIGQKSDWIPLLFWSAVLRKVIQRCAE